MKVPNVSKEVWQELYGATRDFGDVACWEWMSDSDIFGVLNLESGEVGYCCVLGELGDVYGLVVYLGTDGLNQYKTIQSGEVGPDGDDAVFFQNCLKVSFEDRNELSKDDLEVIRVLGLKFRGRNSWPQFRSFRPGYFPWYLTEAEGKYLTLALRQATEVARCFGRDPRMLTGPTKNHYLVRVPVKRGIEWECTGQWLEPPPAARTQPHVEPPDELRLRRIRKTVSRIQGVWQADIFITPISIEEGERPSLPRTLLCADRESYFVLGASVSAQSEWRADLPKKFLEWIESHGILPGELQVKRKDVCETLKPLMAPLNIKLRLVKNLRAVNAAKAAMFTFLSRRTPKLQF